VLGAGGKAWRVELFGQLVVDPIFRKLTRPSDVLEILDEEEISGSAVS
jgi:hypothetical protein